jgi:hypothetical protein
MVWYGMVWYGMVWYGMVWYGMVWYGMVWYGMVWYGMVWYGMVPYMLGRWKMVHSRPMYLERVVIGLTSLIRVKGGGRDGPAEEQPTPA